jgi:hypothetical protein
LKRALHLMVYDCKTDNEAAVETGLTITAIRLALKLPHTRGYYREQLQVLRERESAANIHALVEVRNQKSNQMARVQAVKVLEQIADDAATSGRGVNSLPGLQIVVVTGAQVQQPAIDVSPNTLTHD